MKPVAAKIDIINQNKGGKSYPRKRVSARSSELPEEGSPCYLVGQEDIEVLAILLKLFEKGVAKNQSVEDYVYANLNAEELHKVGSVLIERAR